MLGSRKNKMTCTCQPLAYEKRRALTVGHAEGGRFRQMNMNKIKQDERTNCINYYIYLRSSPDKGLAIGRDNGLSGKVNKFGR